ncbi:MAG: NHL repeat-containing protein [Planctomycetota bacterium]
MNNRLGMVNNKISIGALIALAVVIAVLAVVRLDMTGEKGSGLGEAYTYDLEELAKIDPNLILYEELLPTIGTRFEASKAIAVGSDGRIYVAGDKAIRIFTETAEPAGEIELPDAPTCLTVADDGKLYVGMKDHVQVHDNRGKRLASWPGLGKDAVLTSIAVSEDDVFVADAGNRIVVRYDVTGKLINYIGKKDVERNILGFVIPSPYFDLGVAPDGLLRVVNPGRLRIEAYTFDGDLEYSWGKFSSSIEGFTGCCNPVNFAMLADGSFVTCEKGLVRVKIYDAQGAFVGVVAGPDQLVRGGVSRVCRFPADCQVGGFDVAVDRTQRVLILDTIENVVRIFTKTKAG